ncbi:MAG: PfkB family carbohydrate kinase [Nocardioides sp.]
MDGALVVGESLVDLVHRDGTTHEHPGGSAANVAVALARLGRPVRLATAWADDAYGGLLARHLTQSAVGVVGDPVALDHTATALAEVGEDGSASYTFNVTWRLNPLPDQSPVVVHACSLAAVVEPGAGAVRELLERLRPEATVSYDVNARPAVTGAGPDVVAAVERVVALADLVKASDEDLAILWPDRSWQDAAAALLDRGPSAVVVTRGDHGATWVGRDGSVTVAAEPVAVADTIGAGDTFGAAMIDALWGRGLLGGRLPTLDERAARSVLEHATRAAAINVSRPGAEPPYRHELG